MEISSLQPNNHSQMIQTQLRSKNKVSETKAMDSSPQKPQIQDVLKRKKEGEHLNIREEKLIEMIEQANKFLLKPPTELQFSVHEDTKRISIKIVNTENQEVLREIPPEKLLDMVAKMWELTGLLVDEKA
ncbi:flagellar protein FlaG protein [Alkaliphilus metalliredigens QYMF]|uniref:Flagellar protein FlaG protein n=1 Tax=Alkaliphilus metalliredigens (strain QYMF) TaxID=293826 RepID=A6TP26_ALKMQ|nr:flagellar protein FlaG [Alkaliphilus metalliredigens]ABR47944.1 flagellar protein FlaG protein [Alkaliphilus metalliredigens QYMF]